MIENCAKNISGWFEIPVTDMDRAKKFYEALFGLELEKLDGVDDSDVEMYAFPWVDNAPGSPGALAKQEGMFTPAGPNGIKIYLTAPEDDIELGLKRAEENGGKVIAPKFPIGPYGFIGFFEDSEGNHIGLHSMK